MNMQYLRYILYGAWLVAMLPFTALAQGEGSGGEEGGEGAPMTEEQRRLFKSKQGGWPDIRNYKTEAGGNEYMNYQQFTKEDEDKIINMLLDETKGHSKAQREAQKEFIRLLRKYELTPKEKNGRYQP